MNYQQIKRLLMGHALRIPEVKTVIWGDDRRLHGEQAGTGVIYPLVHLDEWRPMRDGRRPDKFHEVWTGEVNILQGTQPDDYGAQQEALVKTYEILSKFDAQLVRDYELGKISLNTNPGRRPLEGEGIPYGYGWQYLPRIGADVSCFPQNYLPSQPLETVTLAPVGNDGTAALEEFLSPPYAGDGTGTLALVVNGTTFQTLWDASMTAAAYVIEVIAYQINTALGAGTATTDGLHLYLRAPVLAVDTSTGDHFWASINQ